MKDIAGRTVFITGGAQGIGLGIARAFANAGSRLALADIDRHRLADAERELAGVTDIATFELDVRDRDAFEDVAAEVEARIGPVSVLCNNAGIAVVTPVSEMSYQLWDDVIGVNLGGTVNGIQTFLPRMLARGGPGHVVNVASGAGLVGDEQLYYCTSKFAVVGLSESLRHQRELARSGIGVSVVCPGFVRTRIMRNSKRIRDGVPGAPDEREMDSDADGVFERYALPPDVAGECVLRAVQDDVLYVPTDRMMIPAIERRTRALLDAMPAETERDRALTAAFETEIKPAMRRLFTPPGAG